LVEDVQLSHNFRLHEFLESRTAERDPRLVEKQFNPPTSVIANLRYLTEKVLQPIRSRADHGIYISSGYRCWELNQLVNGSDSSQHLFGEASDCDFPPSFLQDKDAATVSFRDEIQSTVKEVTGKYLRKDVNSSFYLFAFTVIHLSLFDIDQVIHEYGRGFGQPAWVHLSASLNRNSRQILAIGRYTETKRVGVREALSWGT
jgi:hypothetical protein